MTRAARTVLGLLAAVIVLAVAASPPAVGQDREDASDRRMLIISIPGLTWEDVNDGPVPTLQGLLDESAIANVSLRVKRLATQAGEGYATLGAGTRAVANRELAGLAYDADAPFGSGTARDERARQLGLVPVGDVLSLTWSQLRAENRRSEFEAELGTLGEALSAAGVGRGVIANADGEDALAVGTVQREAALALADDQGIVPCGEVGTTLLSQEMLAPFGRVLNDERVLEEFRRCSTPHSVVLVEGSDIRRADAYSVRLRGNRPEQVREEALRRTDDLVAKVLAEVDLERDVVMVVAPAVASKPRLGVVGIHAPEVPAGLLVSGSTRQDGYVTLADLTPTIAHLAGASIDEGELEGRTVEIGSTGGSGEERRQRLEDADAIARFRDRMIGPVAGTYIAAVCVLAVAAVIVLTRSGRSLGLEIAALALLAVTPVTYLARLFPFFAWGPAAYWAFVIGASLALGAVYRALGRSWLRPLAAAYAVVLLVIALNVTVLGSSLQLGAVFGDSAIIAGRFNGVNNVMFAQVIIAAMGLAAIIVHSLGGERGRVLMVALLTGVAILIAAPMWGADVGGTLAGIPTLAFAATRLGGWRVRWRTVALWGLAAVAAVVLFGLLDLTRAPADRSHLGRLFERISSEGFDGFVTVVKRKLDTNMRTLSGSVWRFILAPVIVAAVVTAWRAPGRFRDLVQAFPALGRVLPGAICGLVLGYALNDSGIAVPGMMLAVSVPAVVYLLSRVDAGSAQVLEIQDPSRAVTERDLVAGVGE